MSNTITTRAGLIVSAVFALSCAHAEVAPTAAAPPPAPPQASEPAQGGQVVTANATSDAESKTSDVLPSPAADEDGGQPQPPAAQVIDVDAGLSSEPDAGRIASGGDAGPTQVAAVAPPPPVHPVHHVPKPVTPAAPPDVPSIPIAGIPLEALEASQAPFPAAGSEGINVVAGNAGGHAFALGSAQINAPFAKVFAALHDPNVLVDRRRVDTWTTEPTGDRMPAVFRVQNTVHGAAVVQFETTWREGVTEGTPAKPRVACVRGKKTAGSGFIGLLEDSVVVRSVDAGTTAVELVRHLKGLNVGSREAEQYIRDVYANLAAKVHGEPLPKYR